MCVDGAIFSFVLFIGPKRDSLKQVSRNLSQPEKPVATIQAQPKPVATNLSQPLLDRDDVIFVDVNQLRRCRSRLMYGSILEEGSKKIFWPSPPNSMDGRRD
eukprot:scaffold5519_cov166-Amphora_coffeaeformis.AAC.5